ncbi:MAG: LptF/LptG family permease [Bacteroidales bacterium]|nr:LptF/LptG family permease [Bacteroidales bacterium]
MKKLYQYITKSFLGTFVLTFFIVVFIWVMQFVWLYVDDLVGKGLELKIIAELLFYTSITAIPMSLPLALLLALLMCFGNLGEHYELVAMKASGISMWRVMRPLLVFSLMLSILAFFISNSLIPIATLKWRTLLTDVQRQKLAFNIKEGIFYKDIDNYVIYVDKKGKDGSHIYGVKIYDHTDHQGNTKIISADSGMMAMSPNQRSIIFTLYNGHNYTDLTTGDYKETRPFERMSFKEEQLKFSLASFDMTRSNEEMYKSYHQMMNIRQLSTSMDSLKIRLDNKQETFTQGFERRWANYNSYHTDHPIENTAESSADRLVADTCIKLSWPLLDQYDDETRSAIAKIAMGTAQNAKDNVAFNKTDLNYQVENINKHRKEWHKKFTLSIACLIFFFIGAPLGSIIRKGGLGLPVVISVLFFIVYHLISTIAERMAVFGDLNMFLGVWLSSLVLLPVGLFFTFKATTDAALFDGDSWKKFFQRLFKRHKSPDLSVPEPVEGPK